MTGPSDTCSCCRKCGAVAPCASSLAGDYCDGICFCGLPLADELGRRAVACKGWRWLPGMRTACGGTIIRVLDTGWLVTAVALDGPFFGSVGERAASACVPDLDDPATCGCLLALVREAWGNPRIYCEHKSGTDYWIVYDEIYDITGDACPTSEVEALVAALEAAPARESAP